MFFFRKEYPVSKSRLFIRREGCHHAELRIVNPSLWLPIRAVALLEEVDEVVNARIEDLYLAQKVETEDAAVLEKPFLGFLGVL